MSGLNRFLNVKGRLPVFLGLVIVAVTVVAIVGIFRLVGAQQDFELQRWQARLASAGANMGQAASGWVAERRNLLTGAAANPTVQIYLSELALAGFDEARVQSAEAKRGFVGSYIVSLGDRAKFGAGGGIALFAGNGVLVASTADFAPDFSLVASTLIKSEGHSAGVTAVSDQRADGAWLRFVVPVVAMMNPAAGPVGYVVGSARIDADLSEAMRAQSGFSTGAVLLDRRTGAIWRLASEGEAPVWHPLDVMKTDDAALAQAAHAQSQMVDVNGLVAEGALAYAAPVEGTSWLVVASVDRLTALGGVNERLRSLLLTLLFALLAVIAAMLALWRHGVSVNAIATAQVVKAHAEAKVQLYWGLADLLLDAIDQRDPGAAAHSRRVASLSGALMKQGGGSAQEIETAEISGALLNVGKLFVPIDVLTKSGALDPEERGQLSSGSEKWLDLLSKVPFDLPIVEVLSQAHSLMQGRATLATTSSLVAQTIVVANGYVALVSPRTYRHSKSHGDSVSILSASATMNVQVVRMLEQIAV